MGFFLSIQNLPQKHQKSKITQVSESDNFPKFFFDKSVSVKFEEKFVSVIRHFFFKFKIEELLRHDFETFEEKKRENKKLKNSKVCLK